MSYLGNFDAYHQITDSDIAKVEAFACQKETSVLSILFDDMEGSTALKEKIGEQAFQILRKVHDELLTSIITRLGGEVIKSTGDGLLAMFKEPSTAVQCAIEIQEKLYNHPHIKVRIGIDMGQVRVESAGGVQKDMFGRHVDWAARATALADSRHICITHSVYIDALGWIPKTRVTWKEHEFYRFKPDEPPLEIYEPYNANITTPMNTLRGEKVESSTRPWNEISDEKQVFVKKWSRDVLGSFSPDFLKHHQDTTDVIDYYLWHEDHSDWNSGSGLLLSATHKEIPILWAVPDIFTPYESFLLRFIRSGGIALRVFVLGGEFSDPSRRLSFLRVTYRHHLLEFRPHITSVLDLRTVSRNLYVDCDMFGILNDRIAYFLKFPLSQAPLMVRTTDKWFVNKAIKCHKELWEKSEDFIKWYKKQSFQLPKQITKEVEDECATVYEIARHRGKLNNSSFEDSKNYKILSSMFGKKSKGNPVTLVS